MSGRSLFPLTIHLARRISEQFDGKLRISYSGGADAQNIRDLYGAGIWPITMATTVLKPGGYERFSQIAGVLKGAARKDDVDVAAVAALDDAVAEAPKYKKPVKPVPSHKLDWPLPLTSCFTSPCRNGCPIEQDIPAYLAAVDEGRLDDALAIIAERNALPFITGNLCPHPCGTKCMRAFYEPEGASIRASKLTAARGGIDALLAAIKKDGAKAVDGAAGHKVAVIGGGPAGLACAFFLSRAGADVTILERKDAPGRRRPPHHPGVPHLRRGHRPRRRALPRLRRQGPDRRRGQVRGRAQGRGLHRRRRRLRRLGARPRRPGVRRRDRRPRVPRRRQRAARTSPPSAPTS